MASMTGPDVASYPWGGRVRHRLSRWARSHPGALSYGTASVAAVAFYAVSAPLEVALYDVPVPAGLLAPAVQCAALVLALRDRIAAIGAFTAATLVLSLSTTPSSVPWPWTMTGILCFALLVASVWAVSGWRSGVVAYAVPVVALSVPMALRPDAVRVANMIVAIGVGAAAVLVGALLREWTRISRQLMREREYAAAEVERRVVVEERQRIARELHDVVAHGLSLIQVQATFARYRLPAMPDDVAAEIDDIARTSRTALGEMRQMLGALRGDEPAERAPQPTLDDLPALVEETARAGAVVRLRLDAPPDTPTAVGIAAYRIAQEGISNAVRHAPDAPITVSAGAQEGALLVTIENGAGNRDHLERPGRVNGHGLIGMRERASMLGGTLSAGRTAADGFRVTATLPLGSHDS
jgi:signal transduction histidine kinase